LSEESPTEDAEDEKPTSKVTFFRELQYLPCCLDNIEPVFLQCLLSKV